MLQKATGECLIGPQKGTLTLQSVTVSACLQLTYGHKMMNGTTQFNELKLLIQIKENKKEGNRNTQLFDTDAIMAKRLNG